MGKDSINILSNPGQGYVKKRDKLSRVFLQSAEFKVQSANDVSLRDKFYYLDPGVKMHPTKTFVFAGTPRPRMTRENNYAASL